MANENIKMFEIHKPETYDNRFMQLDWNNIGTVCGKLQKIGSKNLYLYLAGNKNNFNFDLRPSAFAKWMGLSYVNEEGVCINQNLRSKINKQISAGIEEMIQTGYIEQVSGNYYRFYECGKNFPTEEKSSEISEKIIPIEENFSHIGKIGEDEKNIPTKEKFSSEEEFKNSWLNQF